LLLALVQRVDDRFAIKEDFYDAMLLASPAKRLKKCLSIWFDFVIKIYPVASDLTRLRKTDPDAAAAWDGRMKLLRSWERELIKSLARDNALATGWSVSDATDFLWAVSSVQIWELLVYDRSWGETKAAEVLQSTITQCLVRDVSTVPAIIESPKKS